MAERAWDVEVDVVVVGYGAAGVCAALEAARAGAEVLVVDRFTGGGSTAISGGVVYAGGGTPVQREAGVADDPEQMFRYLRHETRGAVSDETLRRFCDGSVEMLEWLTSQGVRFGGGATPYPTSYPVGEHHLFEAGNERSAPARAVATPAQRGHLPIARHGAAGHALFDPLAAAARSSGVRLQEQTRATSLLTDDDGVVLGVECATLARAPGRVRREHRVLAGRAGTMSLWYRPVGRRVASRIGQIERRVGRTWRVRARQGVVLATGGFSSDADLVREHGPRYASGLPLGTPADDGTAIRLGRQVGAATDHLDRFSAWRFFTPPAALAKGVLLGPDGERVGNEAMFGATLAEEVVHRHRGRAYLLLDQRIVEEARAQVPTQTQFFQRMRAESMLGPDSLSGATVAEVVEKAGIDVAVAQASVAAYNVTAGVVRVDPLGKPRELLQPLEEPPFLLVDLSVRSSMRFPCPVLSLGGLVVDETTGQVRREDGSLVPGLYAAGRAAVGICSVSYVHGLSLADCVFSGRRAGRAVAAVGHDRVARG